MSKAIKRILSALLCSALLFCTVPLTAVHAADPTSGTCGTNLTWKYNTSTKTLTISGTGAMRDFSADFDNHALVTTAPWRPYFQTMKTVVINSGVTSIGSYAFFGCTGLTNVTIGKDVSEIALRAFEDCTDLASVSIPNSVTRVGYGVFSNCTGLTSISVGTNNLNYSSDSYGVLYNKAKTELIQYPLGNTRTSFTIPNSVTIIGDSAFSNCTALRSVTIPNSVTSIEDNAFSYCTGLISMKIPNSVTSINRFVFYHCTGVSSVTIPDSVTIIGSQAFECCTGLTSVTIPNNVIEIEAAAFLHCTMLSSIIIPDRVSRIGDQAFVNTAYFNEDENWHDNVLYIGNHIIYAKDGLSGAYEIKRGAKCIADYAFDDCTGLKSVAIPDSVTSIGDYAFDGCTSLADVYYGGSESDRQRINIDSHNDSLLNATWHYNEPLGKFTISYNANGGSVSPTSATVTAGNSVTLPTPTKSYKIAYNANGGNSAPAAQTVNLTCKGWSTSSTATSASYSCGANYKPTGSVTLYAVWNNSVTTALSASQPTRSNYRFLGWSTNSSASSPDYASGESISVSGNKTLYAVWEYTGSSDGGSSGDDSIDILEIILFPFILAWNFLLFLFELIVG